MLGNALRPISTTAMPAETISAPRSRLCCSSFEKLGIPDGMRLTAVRAPVGTDLVTVRVCYYPPGTNKWNKIKHRLFSHISINWRGDR